MTETNAFNAIVQTIQKQWSAQPIENLSIADVEQVVMVTGQLSLPASELHLTAIVSQGLTDRSLNLILLASFPETQPLSDGLYAFLHQATALMAPLEFVVDLPSDRLLIRQSHVVSHECALDSNSFLQASRWLVPRLLKSTQQIAQHSLSSADARAMADFLSEQFIEEIAND